jgi:hypothetical protein
MKFLVSAIVALVALSKTAVEGRVLREHISLQDEVNEVHDIFVKEEDVKFFDRLLGKSVRRIRKERKQRNN